MRRKREAELMAPRPAPCPAEIEATALDVEASKLAPSKARDCLLLRPPN